ncbi:hypothetical protein G6F57_015552 [Rhizopus arrhizus]|nr:hypothetical protein G6F24_014103 [Rhizopus arrhizus]KAG0908568.1 hypothetical protein G6F32_016934 [Rhizopus arrhizus]KAG1454231.1 hypothetical protein G6F57_015552 [Rhizopus arrhizus]
MHEASDRSTGTARDDHLWGSRQPAIAARRLLSSFTSKELSTTRSICQPDRPACKRTGPDGDDQGDDHDRPISFVHWGVLRSCTWCRSHGI